MGVIVCFSSFFGGLSYHLENPFDNELSPPKLSQVDCQKTIYKKNQLAKGKDVTLNSECVWFEYSPPLLMLHLKCS